MLENAQKTEQWRNLNRNNVQYAYSKTPCNLLSLFQSIQWTVSLWPILHLFPYPTHWTRFYRFIHKPLSFTVHRTFISLSAIFRFYRHFTSGLYSWFCTLPSPILMPFSHAFLLFLATPSYPSQELSPLIVSFGALVSHLSTQTRALIFPALILKPSPSAPTMPRFFHSTSANMLIVFRYQVTRAPLLPPLSSYPTYWSRFWWFIQ